MWAGLLAMLAGCAAPRRAGPPPDWSQSSGTGQPVALRQAPPSASANSSAASPGLPGQQPAATWQALDEWSLAHGLSSPVCLARSPVATYALDTGRGVLVLQIGSREAMWDGVEVRLGFAPHLIDGRVWLHGLDLRKTLEPLWRGFAPVTRPGRTIVVDPGHGGSNPGARSVATGGWEKDYTLDWAFRLAQRLDARGWRVFLTRTNDTDVPLPDRVALAEACQADLFLSLHFNSTGNGQSQAGVETYCMAAAGMPSDITRGYNDDLQTVHPNNAWDEQNLPLAVAVHRAVLRATGQTDRGVRRARFMTVLQGQRRPAVLLEGGYLSNPAEARRVADWRFREALAEAVAAALP